MHRGVSGGALQCGGSSMTPLIIQYLLPFFSHIVYTRAEELRRNDGRSQTTIAPRIFHPIYHTAKQETAAARRRGAPQVAVPTAAVTARCHCFPA